MAVIHLPNGTGDTQRGILGDSGPIEVNGNVWYVHYGTGTDGASPAGQNRQSPLKTLAQADTNAASGDVIVLMRGHEETLTASITATKSLVVVGEGSEDGKPTVKITNNGAATCPFYLQSTMFYEIRNIWFKEQAQACTWPKIYINGANCSFRIIGCYFEGGQYDDAEQITTDGAEAIVIKKTTFVSIATSLATRPRMAIRTTSSTNSVIIIDDVVVDGGQYGWTSYYSVDFYNSTINSFVAENLSLLRGSDVRIPQNTVGYISARSSTGGCRIDWDGVL